MKAPRYFSGYIWLAIGAGLVALLGGGWYTVRHVAGNWLNNHLIERYNRSAAEELAKGDAPNALVLARRSLQRAPGHVEAWRLAAAAARQRDQPDALYYQENLARVDPSKENKYELIRLTLHFGMDADAVRQIKALTGTAKDDAAYLTLAAQAYLRQGNALAARFHLISLLALQPADTAAQLDLALIDLAAETASQPPGLREKIRQLAEIPALRRPALTGLIRHCIKTKQAEEGRALMTALEAQPESSPADRLLLLEAAYAFTPGTATARLLRLQQAAAANADDAAGLIDFMAEHGQESVATGWAAELPPATRQTEPVRRALADCHLRLQAWDQLRAVALEDEWPAREFLRRALLAHTYRAQTRLTEFNEAWNGAVQLAGASFNHTRELLGRIEAWHWNRERFDLLWKLFSFLPGHLELRREIANWEHQQGNTANLLRLFSQVTDFTPADGESRANVAYCTLLLDADLPGATTTFRELIALDPQNPYFATGHALALLKQERFPEALATLSTLRPSHLAVPERMSLHAWLLALNGRVDEAEITLNSLVSDGLLPEEKKFADNARQEIARLRRTREQESQLALGQGGAGSGGERNGWLFLIHSRLAAPPTFDMRLSDRLFSRRDVPGLARLVRNGDWRNQEHLRLALLAYAVKSDDPAAAREAWTHALTRARQEPAGVAQLEILAADWHWAVEQIEALNLLNQQDPVDRERLNRLLAYYRERQRTAELIRVLRPWMERAPDSAESLLYFYYSLLANLETSRAVVAAAEVYAARPNDADRTLLHAFALSRAGRRDDATRLLDALPEKPGSSLPGALIRAVVLADAGRADEAARALARFDSAKALPEELALIRKITQKTAGSP